MLTAIKNLVASVPPMVIAVIVLVIAAVLFWLWRRRSAPKVQTAPPMPMPVEEYSTNQMAVADANAAMYASTVRDGLDQENSTVGPIMTPAAPGDIQPSDVMPDDIYDREDDGDDQNGDDGEYDDGGEYGDDDEYEPME